MVKRKKILVALGAEHIDLKSVHYSLAVADRMQADVLILVVKRSEAPLEAKNGWEEEALLDLINSARLAGLRVAYHKAVSPVEAEVLNMVKEEGIDMLVFGEDDSDLKHLLLQIRSKLPSRIIQVKEKNNISYL